MEIYSPYRICPLGAHIDHQLGMVLGTTINRGIHFRFAPDKEGNVRLKSLKYKEWIEFPLYDNSIKTGHWSDYVKGAVWVLQGREKLKYGINGEIEADFPGGGLSSSAAISVAYLLALEKVNDLHYTSEENIRLVQKLENEYIGLNNGILDQSMILLTESVPDSMVYLDCKTLKHKIITPEKHISAPRPLGEDIPSYSPRPLGENIPSPFPRPLGDNIPFSSPRPLGERVRVRGNKVEFEVAVVYSGIEEPLTNTGYNTRVAECEEAARILLKNVPRYSSLQETKFPSFVIANEVKQSHRLPRREKARNDKNIKLRDVPEEVFHKYKNKLSPNLRKRATHFFTEMERVKKGAVLWQKGDLSGFGRLMTESGRSSIENYECGTPALIKIYEILNSISGVYGARFSGAGFRGSCIGLIKPSEDVRDKIRGDIERYYKKEFSQYADKTKIAFCKTNVPVGYSDKTEK